MARALEAGAGGDASACLAHELSGPVIAESPHGFILKDLVDQGDLAPSWAYSRWCLDLAYRSMLLSCDPRTDEAVRLVMGTLCPDSVGACSSEADWRFLRTMLAARDHAVQDLALFELGGQADNLA